MLSVEAELPDSNPAFAKQEPTLALPAIVIELALIHLLFFARFSRIGHSFLTHEHVVGVHYGRHHAGVDQRF